VAVSDLIRGRVRQRKGRACTKKNRRLKGEGKRCGAKTQGEGGKSIFALKERERYLKPIEGRGVRWKKFTPSKLMVNFTRPPKTLVEKPAESALKCPLVGDQKRKGGGGRLRKTAEKKRPDNETRQQFGIGGKGSRSVCVAGLAEVDKRKGGGPLPFPKKNRSPGMHKEEGGAFPSEGSGGFVGNGSGLPDLFLKS